MNRSALYGKSLCWSVVMIAIALFEGVSFARTTLSTIAEYAQAGDVVAGDSAHGSVTKVEVSVERLATRIPVCHISRHPRDGIRAELHACPLVLADRRNDRSAATDAPAQGRFGDL
jgi:hypothetical protein